MDSMKVELNVAEELKEIKESLNAIHVEIALLKYKSGIWGLFGASIPIIIMLAMQMLKDQHT